MTIALKYALFVLLATLINIGSQEISLKVYGGPYSVPVSVLVGTAAGLLLKYYLDKKYIFLFSARSVIHDSKTFALYTGMGVITTLIFWGFEFSFDYFFQTKEMRYLGAVIGLLIGYNLKYRLDKRFVFLRQAG